jgi:hypothetical protein
LLRLIADNVRAKVAIRSAPIPLLAELLREVENNGNGQHMELACQGNERFARIGLDVCRVDNGQPPRSESFSGDEMEHLECIVPDISGGVARASLKSLRLS